MSSSIHHRRAPGLMAGWTLLLSSVLFSSCTILDRLFGDPEQYSHRPSMVLLAKSDDITSDGAQVKIDINKIRIGNVSLSDLMGKPTHWRVNLYTWRGELVGKYAAYMPYTMKETTVEKVPLNTLLRADLDLNLSGTPNGPDAETAIKSFGVVVIAYPENEMKK